MCLCVHISSFGNNIRFRATSSVVRNLDANNNDFTYPSTKQCYKIISTCIGIVHAQEFSLHVFFCYKKIKLSMNRNILICLYIKY